MISEKCIKRVLPSLAIQWDETEETYEFLRTCGLEPNTMPIDMPKWEVVVGFSSAVSGHYSVSKGDWVVIEIPEYSDDLKPMSSHPVKFSVWSVEKYRRYYLKYEAGPLEKLIEFSRKNPNHGVDVMVDPG